MQHHTGIVSNRGRFIVDGAVRGTVLHRGGVTGGRYYVAYRGAPEPRATLPLKVELGVRGEALVSTLTLLIINLADWASSESAPCFHSK